MTISNDLIPIKGIFFSRYDGSFLISVKFDDSFDECLLSAFIGALQMFGKESIGKIEEINIKGLDVEVLIVNKYDLILTAVLSSSLKKINLRSEAEKALDAFYNKFKDELANWDSNIEKFQIFKRDLKEQISEYLAKTNNNENDSNGNAGSFWEIILNKVQSL